MFDMDHQSPRLATTGVNHRRLDECHGNPQEDFGFTSEVLSQHLLSDVTSVNENRATLDSTENLHKRPSP